MQKALCKYTVTIQRKDQTMTKVVNEDSFTIGRSLDCTISLSDESISRVHLQVFRRQDQIWIEDKNSSNGTFVNGTKIVQSTLVNVVPEDTILLGKSEYIIHIELKVNEKLLDPEIQKKQEPSESTEVLQSPFALKFKGPAKALESVRDLAKDIQRELGRDPNKEPTRDVSREAKEAAARDVSREATREQKETPKEVLKEPTRTEPKEPMNEVALRAPNVPEVAHKDHSLEASYDLHRQSLAEAKEKSAAANFEAERIIHEARKKAAQILYEGEVQAEKRVQTIYQKARDLQNDAENFHKQQIADAHRRADVIIEEFQKQGQELLVDARNFARELREEVEMYVQNLREKGRQEGEAIVDAARKESDAIRQDVYEKAKAETDQEVAKVLSAARFEAQEVANFAKMQSESMLAKAQSECEAALQELQVMLEQRKQELQEFNHEVAEFKNVGNGEKDILSREISELREQLAGQVAQLNSVKAEYALTREQQEATKNLMTEQEKIHEDLRNKVFLMGNEKKVLEGKVKDSQEQLGHLSLEIQSGEERRKQIESEYSQQKNQFRDKLEKEQGQVAKEYKERVEGAQLEVERRLQKLERDLFDEILNRKEKMAKEILAIVETRIAKIVEPSKWNQVSGLVFEGIHEVFEGKAVSFTQTSGTSSTTQTVLSMPLRKKRDRIRWTTTGIVAGLVLTFGGQYIYNIVNKDRNPMQTMVQEESRRRAEDLARRRFNPQQTSELRDSYTDSVIYTSDYVHAYLDPQFQQKLYKATSSYLLKTWRVDEDKSIQVLSMASALVKELSERKQGIHPDFVKEGVGKMRALETDSMNRMKDVLGSEVRVESFRRFERKFYEQEVLTRRSIATEKPSAPVTPVTPGK